jgi:hypothetical protein
MPVEHLIISNIDTGYETDRVAWNIKNDAFPVLNNAYLFRGRCLRKRGDQLLGRLRRNLTSDSIGLTGASPWTFNIYSTLVPPITGEPDAQIVPGTVVITIAGPIVFTDQGDGTLTSATPGNSGTINYSTGSVTLIHTAGAGVATTITFSYFPLLPAMGLEDFNIGSSPQPILIGFDTKYSYGFNQGTNQFYDVNFYKTTGLPFIWNGQDYQQFWTTNYLGINTILNTGSATGCMWATNGNPGFHFLNGTYVSGSGTAVIQFTFTSLGAPFQTLQVGDILWFNEWAGGSTINGVNGTVTTIVNAATGTYDVTFTAAQTVAGAGIAQMLTNFVAGQDGIRWYDGDPTVASTFGWVNFAPPLSAYPANTNPMYLVGAKMVIPFKNRLLFFGVYLRTSASSPGAQYYPNRVVYSQVGTPFYTLPMPFDLTGQLPQPAAWYQNIAGRGGFIAAPIDDEITVVAENEDLVITIFETQPLKLIFTSDDTLPFIFQTVSAELGAFSTFSGIKLDTGVISFGTYGITLCTSVSTQRIDLQIPDQIFDVAISNNRTKRVTAVRDYQKELTYFTYCPGSRNNIKFPSKTLLYNYRENNWATLDENFTTYGTFRRTTNRTWANIGQIYPTWSVWTDPWDFGAGQAFFPTIIGGNQHGFVMQKGLSTTENPAQFIKSVSGNIITSTAHGLQTGDFIQISGMLGSTNLNGTIQQITVQSPDTFSINEAATGVYIGGGVYFRISRPFIQTRQFPVYWKDGRQVRVGISRFLFETTPTGQVTVNTYSSQNANQPSNLPATNGYLSYTNVVFTSAEPSLYSADPVPYASQQAQIWHRLSNSFNGDTIQFAITLSDTQMRNSSLNLQEIMLHAIVLDLYPGPALP